VDTNSTNMQVDDNELLVSASHLPETEPWLCMMSGVIFTPDWPQHKSWYARRSRPVETRCFAPTIAKKRRRGESDTKKHRRHRCSRIVKSVGPYCRAHSIMYHNVSVDESTIAPNMRGLFARASPYHAATLRNEYVTMEESAHYRLTKSQLQEYRSRKRPIFRRDDVVAFFGGVLVPQNSGKGEDKNADESSLEADESYVIEFADKEQWRAQTYYLDSYVESCGEARFANSAIRFNGRSIGLDNVNCRISCYIYPKESFSDGVALCQGRTVRTMPCLVADCDIFDGDEFITDYGLNYWEPHNIKKLPANFQKYLHKQTDEKPSFFHNLK